MTKLLDIQSEIARLQKQANEIRAKEFDSTVSDILAKMAAFGITLKDLQAKPRKSGKAKPGRPVKVSVKKAGGERKSVAAKYKGPNGETWSGRGLTPKWMATLIESGSSKDAFLIQSN